ncbi:MAG: peptidoglycan hydrolase-like protein with peptidoglycan-binding domain [Gammaproteobacteria bacterium]|jgi:peptidoglycan hydrolase-like protein with peptidoglycan-binding domain
MRYGQVLAEAAKTVEVEIPAEYKTLTVKWVAEAPREIRNPTEDNDQEVTKTRMVADGKLAWRPNLVRNQYHGKVVNRLQSALRAAGYRPGPTDGAVGSQTMAAVKRHQVDKGLARGKLTIKTPKKPGVM